jgi:hypothetical protein
MVAAGSPPRYARGTILDRRDYHLGEVTANGGL